MINSLIMLILSLILLASPYKIIQHQYQTQKIFIQGTVSCFDSLTDTSLFATGTKEGTLLIYTEYANNTYNPQSVIDIGETINVLALNKQGFVAAGLQNGTVILYSLKQETKKIQILEHTLYSILSIQFSEDSQILFTGSADSTIRVYKREQGSQIYTLFQSMKNAYNGICALKSLEDGQTIITGSYDKMVRIYTILQNQTKYSLTQTVQQAQNYACAIDVLNDTVAIGSTDFNVRIYRFSFKKKILFNRQTISDSTDGILRVKFLENNQKLITTGDDGIVRLYEKINDQFVFKEEILNNIYPVVFLNYNLDLKQIQILSIDGIYRRYLTCPKLACQNKCYLYSKCPSCYHSQYFTKLQNSKYCNIIDQSYVLQKSEVEYSQEWYQNWYLWGGLTLIKIISVIVMRKKLIAQYYQCMRLFKRNHTNFYPAQSGSQIVGPTTHTLPDHIQLPQIQEADPVEMNPESI